MLLRLASLGLLANLLLARWAAGQIGPEPPALPPVPAGISVYGTGEAEARPNTVEVSVRVIGRGELADDATLKYKQAKKNTLDALAALKLDGMEIKEQGMVVGTATAAGNRQVIVNGRRVNAQRSQLEVSNVLRLRLGGLAELADDEVLRKVSALVETVQDSGGQMTGASVAAYGDGQVYYNNQAQMQAVRFLLVDLAEMREKVYEQAVADARERATRLAKLTGVKLGSPLAVQEVMVTGDAPRGTGDKGELSSPARTDAKLRVKLLVRYAIEPMDRGAKVEQGAKAAAASGE